MKKISVFLAILGYLVLEGLVVYLAGVTNYGILGLSVIPVILGFMGILMMQHQGSRDRVTQVSMNGPEKRPPASGSTLSPDPSGEPIEPECPEDWNGIPTWQLETEVYEKALPALFQSIVNYFNSTSQPMSESLVAIKTAIKDFLNQVHTHGEEITSSQALEKVSGNVDSLNDRINLVTKESEETFVVFGRELQRLRDLLGSIFKLTGNISEIAERVHVLSINASIESARAGIHGRGFKVIAGEIQKLAHETQSFIKDIGITTETSQEIFGSIDREIDRNRTSLVEMVRKEQETFDDLNGCITRHYTQFKDLYSGIITFIQGLEGNMANLFPLAMLHAIIIQEVENLSHVTGDFTQLLKGLSQDPHGVCREFEAVATLGRLRKRLTTSRELDALEKVVNALGLQDQVDLKRSNSDYELF